VVNLGCEFVGLEYLPSGKHSLLRVYIDHPEGVALEHCEAVSRQVSSVLDVEDPITGQYNLEVSSPGLDRMLFTEPQFMAFTGHKVTLRLLRAQNGQRNFKGVIEAVNGANIQVRTFEDELLTFTLKELDKARIIPDF
jgi:ribosome maturation factor RimP